MIIGDGVALHFTELDDAVRALAGNRIVALNAHTDPTAVPEGAIVYNLENLGLQLEPDAFPNHEVWDFSARNVEAWKPRKVTHVPVGYHPSMERFDMKPWGERDIDVVFTGVVNERRRVILQALADRGLHIAVVPPGVYGSERDQILARSKLALSMLFYETGTYGTLRAAHCAANRLPIISEVAPEIPSWVPKGIRYDELVDVIEFMLDKRHAPALQAMADQTYEAFKATPMTLPKTECGPFEDPRWAMVRDKPPEEWDLAAMYDAARGGPVSDKPLPVIIVPSYRETEYVAQRSRLSRNAVRQDLAAHGIESLVAPIVGDSLICRMRQRACHVFLMSPATHMLFWDADIECVTPDCVRKMLATGHDLIAGACPFKAPGGKTVHNMDDDATPVVGDDGCVEVRDAGTGFMMVSRMALIRLMEAAPDLLHWSISQDKDRGAPLWALFNTGIVDGVFQSEDYMFCRYWQALDEKVYVYAPAQFRHWGEFGYEGSFLEQYGLA